MIQFATTISLMQKNDVKQIGTCLLSAIDMEEAIANGVYLDYTARKNWPDDIDQKTYGKIQSLLKILITDTARHSKIFSELKEKLTQS